MKILTAINQYIDYRKSLGECFEDGAGILRFFVRSMGAEINFSEIKLESVSKFLVGKKLVITASWHNKYRALRGFYRYAISRGYTTASPLPLVTPKLPPRFVPYIYSVHELRALFGACFQYPIIRKQLDPYMLQTLLVLLYGTGLRIREAIRLTLADVDLGQALLIIRGTKFYKTRFVPIGQPLIEVLQRYLALRQQGRYSQDPESPFFVGRNGKAVNQDTIGRAFQIIRAKVNVRRSDGASCQPRLHDLRHTFAVHRLTACYKEGSDVQRLLPVLSIYMGHSSLAATTTYLTMTPALLEEAGRLFEQYAFKEASHD